jgi:hypothetical protein
MSPCPWLSPYLNDTGIPDGKLSIILSSSSSNLDFVRSRSGILLLALVTTILWGSDKSGQLL